MSEIYFFRVNSTYTCKNWPKFLLIELSHFQKIPPSDIFHSYSVSPSLFPSFLHSFLPSFLPFFLSSLPLSPLSFFLLYFLFGIVCGHRHFAVFPRCQWQLPTGDPHVVRQMLDLLESLTQIISCLPDGSYIFQSGFCVTLEVTFYITNFMQVQGFGYE